MSIMGYKYLGRRYLDISNNLYYSLFGLELKYQLSNGSP